MNKKILLVVMVLSGLALAIGLTGFKADHKSHAQALLNEDEDQTVEQGNSICPVMGADVDEQVSYEYEGRKYYFCCPGCIDEFKSDPDFYIEKMREQKA